MLNRKVAVVSYVFSYLVALCNMEETNKNMKFGQFKGLVETVEMNVMELAELVKVMEQKFGVSATPTAFGVGSDLWRRSCMDAEENDFDVELNTDSQRSPSLSGT